MADFWRPLIAAPIAIAFILAIGQCTDLIANAWGGECYPLAVTRVIDGDTVEAGEEHIRISNIDTPETWRPRCEREEMLGLLSTQRAAQIIYSASEVQFCPDGTDRYGRTLATVRVDGQDLGEMLIAERLARPWRGKREEWCEPAP